MQALFEKHLPWAEAIAREVKRGLPPSFDVQDLEQAARIEHWRRVQSYDPARNNEYRGYAYLAIRGAVLMSCRRKEYRERTHDELHARHVDPRPLPDQILLEREERRNCSGPRERRKLAKVRAAMATLPAADAYLLRRVFLENVDAEALGAAWFSDPKVLRGRLSKAMARLRRQVRRATPAVTATPPLQTPELVGEYT